MKAIVVHEDRGGPEVLKFEECPDPVPGRGEVLVRVAAASINPIDYKRRAGFDEGFLSDSLPGSDRSRYVRDRCEVGPGVVTFTEGNQVFAMATTRTRSSA